MIHVATMIQATGMRSSITGSSETATLVIRINFPVSHLARRGQIAVFSGRSFRAGVADHLGIGIGTPIRDVLVTFLRALKIIKFRLPSARESQGEEGSCSEYADRGVQFESDLYHESTHSASERECYAISIPSHFQALDGTVAPGIGTGNLPHMPERARALLASKDRRLAKEAGCS